MWWKALCSKNIEGPLCEGSDWSHWKYSWIVLWSHTQGRDFAGTVATTLRRIDSRLYRFDIDPETKYLKQTRPAFGGNIWQRFSTTQLRPKCPRSTQVFACSRMIREKGRSSGDSPDDRRSGQDKIVEFIKGAETVNLADAEIIVSGEEVWEGQRVLSRFGRWLRF